MKTNTGGFYSFAISLVLLSTLLAAGKLSAQGAPPVILQPPTSQIAAAGGAFTQSVSVSGAGSYTYQWFFNGSPLTVTNLVTTNTIITTVAGNGSCGTWPYGGGYSGDGGLATNACLNLQSPLLDGAPFSGLVLDGSGDLYVADSRNNVIRMVDPSGYIWTVAGNYSLGGGYSGDGGAATNAALNTPGGITLDGSGDLYIADAGNNVIRMVDASGKIWTVAGGGSWGSTLGDGGPATSAVLTEPTDVALDGSGDLFIADNGDQVIRMVDTSGNIGTVAGNWGDEGYLGYWGNGSPATEADFQTPGGITLDGAGNLYISDRDNAIVRMVGGGGITTIAGGGGVDTNGVPGTDVWLTSPVGLLTDGLGDLYISDPYANVVRMLDTNDIIWTAVGSGNQGYFGDGGAATNAWLNTPSGLALDGNGNLYIADSGNNVIRKTSVATIDTFYTTGVQTNMTGNYQVVVSNGYGSTTSSIVSLTVVVPPAITAQPVSQTNFQGSNVVFGVTATGGALNYQWCFGGNPLAGATNSTLDLIDVQAANAGAYYVVVTNVAGSATSSNAWLTVLTPPIIRSQPTNQVVIVNEPATFNVTATGWAPLIYQWKFDGTNISGATNATLTLTTPQLSQAGNYTVQITNLLGSVTSSVAVLTVYPPACIPPPAGIVSWWQANSNASDCVGPNNGTWVGTAAYTTGEVGQAFSVSTNNYVSVPDSASLDQFTTNITIEFWTKGSGPIDNWFSMVCKTDSGYEIRLNDHTNTASFVINGLSNGNLVGTRNIHDGNWHYIAGVYDGTNMYLYVDGTLDTQQPDTGTINCAVGTPLDIGTAANYATARAYTGQIDEVAIYNKALTASQIAAIYYAAYEGKCPPSPPTITSQPTNQEVSVGGLATFTVAATGWSPLSYQWEYDGAIISGATNTTLTLTNVQLGEAGYYSAVVSNVAGTATSTNAVLTVDPTPPCDQAPAGLVSWWQANGTANDTAYTNNGSWSGTAAYVNGKSGEAFYVSTNNYVTIHDSPSLDQFTTNLTIEFWTKGSGPIDNWFSMVCKTDSGYEIRLNDHTNTASFVINGLSNGNLVGTRNIHDGNWHHIAGVYDGAHMYLYVDGTLDSQQADTGTINCAVGTPLDIGTAPNYTTARAYTGAIDEVAIYKTALNSNQIAAIYNAGSGGKCPPSPPVITSQPVNTVAVVNGTASFSVTAMGWLPMSYQWKFNGTNISGGTNSTLSLTSVQLSQAGNYSVVVSNYLGSATSTNASLIVAVAPVITAQPVSLTVGQGSNANFTVTATGGALSYQWWFAGDDVLVGTNATLTLTDATLVEAGDYYVTVSNLAGSVTSSNALLTVLVPPLITTQPTNEVVAAGGTAVFAPSISDTFPDTYQWLFDGVPIDLITTVAGDYYLGGNYAGDGGAATNAALSDPESVAVDGYGDLFIADTGNNVIREVSAAGIITTVAGNNSLSGGYSGDGGAATNATLNFPTGVAVDGAGNIYIADQWNHVVRQVDINGNIWTVAGNNSLGGGYSGDGGAATNAALADPAGVAVDGSGDLYIADSGNNVIRVVDANGNIWTVAGNHSLGAGYSGDGGAATNAGLNFPYEVALDGAGNMYLADYGNHVIRKVDASGIMTTVAGNHSLAGTYSGDGGAATNAGLNYPSGVTADGAGDIYISDGWNHAIRKVNAGGTITTLAGDGSGGYSGDGGLASNATLYAPSKVTLDSAGNLYIADTWNNVVRKVTSPGLDGTVAISTNGVLTITGLQTNADGMYQAIISNAYGSTTSSIVTLTVCAPPVIQAQPANQIIFQGGNAVFNVAVNGSQPLSYQWLKNRALLTDGGNIAGANSSALNIIGVRPSDAGLYSVIVSNYAGVATSYYANLRVWSLNDVVAWGWDIAGQTNVPAGLTNIVSIAAGGFHSLALNNSGTVTGWGAGSFVSSPEDYYDYGQIEIPSGLTNVVSVAAGGYHSLALKSNGTVAAWGAGSFVASPEDYYNYGQIEIPPGLSNVVSVAAGGCHSLALKWDGTVVAWGSDIDGQTNVPSSATNVVKISGGWWHSLALRSDGTVIGWGDDEFGQIDIPADLTNVVAIAAGVWSNVALKSDGTVEAWGYDGEGETDVPDGLTNVVDISASGYHTVALKSDGSVVTWGWDAYGETDMPAGLTNVTAIAGGVFHSTVIGQFVPMIVTQPSNQVVDQGETATFTVGTAGPGLAYQWSFNGSPIAGATQATLILTNAQYTEAGSYSVAATNAYGAASSSSVSLSVNGG